MIFPNPIHVLKGDNSKIMNLFQQLCVYFFSVCDFTFYGFKNKTIILPGKKKKGLTMTRIMMHGNKKKPITIIMRVSTNAHVHKFKVNQWKQLMLANENYDGFSSIFHKN